LTAEPSWRGKLAAEVVEFVRGAPLLPQAGLALEHARLSLNFCNEHEEHCD